MTVYAALLRGVNVGGNRRMAMADLRDVLAALGHSNVTTVLQSGNAIFSSEVGDPARLEADVERGIARRLALDVRVLLRTHADLARIVRDNPFPEATSEPARLFAMFLSADPEPDRLAAFDVTRFAPDRIRFGQRVAYGSYTTGIGRSKLTGQVLERLLGVTVTARNWNTVTRLLELTDEAVGAN